jgi:hypothetical protein
MPGYPTTVVFTGNVRVKRVGRKSILDQFLFLVFDIFLAFEPQNMKIDEILCWHSDFENWVCKHKISTSLLGSGVRKRFSHEALSSNANLVSRFWVLQK